MSILLCQWCFKLSTKANPRQLYCKSLHEDICKACGGGFSWLGKPTHLYSSAPHHCSPCRAKLGQQRSKESWAGKSAEEVEQVTAARKATMLQLHGGATTLQAPQLRAAKEATMVERYGGAQTRTSTAKELNSAARRANSQGLSIERSLELGRLLNSEELLKSYLAELTQARGRRVTVAEVAAELGASAAEVSHRLASFAKLRAAFLAKRDSYLELAVIEFCKELGYEEGSTLLRRRRLPSGLEIDILLEQRIGLEINDFATHSRDSDSEISSFRFTKGALKKGPTYHAEKQAEAARNGITLHFLWEDDIISGGFKSNLSKLLDRKPL